MTAKDKELLLDQVERIRQAKKDEDDSFLKLTASRVQVSNDESAWKNAQAKTINEKVKLDKMLENQQS